MFPNNSPGSSFSPWIMWKVGTILPNNKNNNKVHQRFLKKCTTKTAKSWIAIIFFVSLQFHARNCSSHFYHGDLCVINHINVCIFVWRTLGALVCPLFGIFGGVLRRNFPLEQEGMRLLKWRHSSSWSLLDLVDVSSINQASVQQHFKFTGNPHCTSYSHISFSIIWLRRVREKETDKSLPVILHLAT